MYVIFIFVAALSICNAAQLPATIHPCKKSDADLTTCLTKEVNRLLPLVLNGIPEINLPKLDPLKLDSIKIKIPGMDYLSRNNTVENFGKAKIEEFSVNFDKKKMNFAFRSSIAKMTCQYDVKGRVLLFDLNGSGNQVMYMDNLYVKLIMDWDIKKNKKGIEHMYIHKFKVEHTVDRIRYEITGFLNDDFDKVFNQVLNDNWSLLWDDVGQPAMNEAMRAVVEIFNKVLAKVAVADLFPK